MSDQLGTLEKAREELRKQFFSYAQSFSALVHIGNYSSHALGEIVASKRWF